MMFGLCETSTMLVPAGGAVEASLRIAAARRLFSIGVTTRPPSVMSALGVTAPKPSSVPVSTARLNWLVTTCPTGMLQLAHRVADLARERAAVIVELALLGDVGDVERIGVGLILMRRAVAEHDHVPAARAAPSIGLHHAGIDLRVRRRGERRGQQGRARATSRIARLLV